MRCPFCQNQETKVIDSRLNSDGDNIRRRRECETCNQRFTTYERYDDIMPMVVKKDGSLDSFDSQKILRGVQRACEKRPVSSEQILSIVEDIEKAMRTQEKKEVPVSFIGEMIMDRLKELDHVAYVRFASVYRSFRDVNEFLNEIKTLIR